MYVFGNSQSCIDLENLNSKIINHYGLSNKVEKYFFESFGVSACFYWALSSEIKWKQFSEDDDLIVFYEGVPIGWNALVGDSDDYELALGHIILKDSSALEKLSGLFSVVIIDKVNQKIKVWNDILGLSKVYTTEKDGVSVVGNKISNIGYYLGKPLCLSETSWRLFSVLGWFPGELTPIEGVKRIGPSSAITVTSSGRDIEDLKIYKNIFNVGREEFNDSALLASSIKADIESYTSTMNVDVSCMLSGGRDSRVSAASLIASKAKATFKTLGPLQGEIDVAKDLIERVGACSDHVVSDPLSRERVDTIFDRCSVLHEKFDGDYTPVKMMGAAPSLRINPIRRVTLTGTGGEIAHGNYYSNTKLLELMKTEGPIPRLLRYFQALGCHNEKSVPILNEFLLEIESEANSYGIKGPSVADFFYLKERTRRWAPLSDQPTTFSPYFSLSFVRAAMSMTPEERLNNSLHNDLISNLVPEWKNLDFYKRKPGEGVDEKTKKKQRIWQQKESSDIYSLIVETLSSCDFFDADYVLELWGKAVDEGVHNRDEAVFQRVIWLGTFKKYLSELNARIKKISLESEAVSL